LHLICVTSESDMCTRLTRWNKSHGLSSARFSTSYTSLCSIFALYTPFVGDRRWRSWLRHSATSWKVTGLVTDAVVRISHRHNPPGHTMGTRNISWGGGGVKGGRCLGLVNLPLICADSLEIWESQPPGILRACQACNGICFTFSPLVI
jgi:hypothetical protein